MHTVRASDEREATEPFGIEWAPEDPPPPGLWDNAPEIGRDGSLLPPSDLGADGMPCACYGCPSVLSPQCCRAAQRKLLLARLLDKDLEAENYARGQVRRNFIRLTLERIFR